MKYIFQPATALTTLLLLTFIACKDKSRETKAADITVAYKPVNNTGDIAGNKQEDNQNGNQKEKKSPPDQNQAKQSADWDKKIIKTGTINIEVKNYQDFNTQVHNIAKQFGGYIAQEQQAQSDYKLENTVILKVPVEQFDAAVAALTPVKEKIIDKKIVSEDVTGEMVDIQSRMEAKRQVRLRYLDLLKQAKNMEEILQVQNEINSTQEQIESAAGRINYLGHAATFSTIQLTFFEVLNTDAKDIDNPSFWQKTAVSFRKGGEWIGDVLLALIAIWPLWCLAALGWWGYRKWKPAVAKK